MYKYTPGSTEFTVDSQRTLISIVYLKFQSANALQRVLNSQWTLNGHSFQSCLLRLHIYKYITWSTEFTVDASQTHYKEYAIHSGLLTDTHFNRVFWSFKVQMLCREYWIHSGLLADTNFNLVFCSFKVQILCRKYWIHSGRLTDTNFNHVF